MVARNMPFISLPYDMQYRIASSYSDAVKLCNGPINTASELINKWKIKNVLLGEIEDNIKTKYAAYLSTFSHTLALLDSVEPYKPPETYKSEPQIEVKGDTYEPSVKSVGDLAGKLDIREVSTDRPKLTKLEKWSLLVDGKRTIYETQESAMESAKRRAKPAMLYHHIQEIDNDGIVHHSEDKYVGNFGYADDKSRERVILTFKASSFASAAKKGTIKETKKKRKYYV